MNTIFILKKTLFSGDVSETELSRIAEICLEKTVRKKEVLFLEGDRGFSFYILAAGSIKLFKTAEGGEETVIKLIKPGEMFGEVILFEADRYPVSAVALTGSRLLMIPKHQFICLLNSEGFRNEFIGGLMRKMRYLTNQLKYLTNFDVEERLFQFLRDQYGTNSEQKIDISKKEIAAAIMTTPETLSRLLQRLKHEGKITWDGNMLIRHTLLP
ncbi:Crp/Fnr family transcriptional regulator [bacterium]|nr:Crp/Fnr family transcriptional regulator [bacterium]